MEENNETRAFMETKYDMPPSQEEAESSSSNSVQQPKSNLQSLVLPSQVKRFLDSFSDSCSVPKSATRLTVPKIVDDEITRYKSLNLSFRDITMDGFLEWWGNTTQFPVLRVVAASLLGQQASAGGMERDFCPAGRLLSGLRSSLSPSFVEMILFCHLNFGSIPDFISELCEDARKAAVPVAHGKELDDFMFPSEQTELVEESGSESDSDSI